MDLEEKIKVIKNSQFLRSASDDIIKELAEGAVERHYLTDESIYNEGDLGNSIFIVAKGHLKVLSDGVIKTELKEYNSFGELSMLTSKVRQVSVAAIEPSIVLEITSETLFQIMDKHHQLYKEVIEVLCQQEINNLKEKLAQSEKLASLGLITSGIANELKNPINYILNLSMLAFVCLNETLEFLEKNNKEIDVDKVRYELAEVLKKLQKIQSHSHRANNIVTKLLSHFHLSGFQFERVSIPKLIKQAIELSLDEFKDKNPRFNVEIEEKYDFDHQICKVAPFDLVRVFINILDNAFYAMNERKKLGDPLYTPTLEIEYKDYTDEVKISFKDNGGGISLSNMDHIFQPFFSTKPAGVGIGLGLPLSYDIITKIHKGSLIVNTDYCDYTKIIILIPK